MIPAKATAKVSIRLVPRQDPDKVITGFRKFLEKNTPKGIRTEAKVLSASPAVMVNPDHPAIQIAAKAFSDILQNPTVFIRSGGSIPCCVRFATPLKYSNNLMLSRFPPPLPTLPR